MNSKINNIQVLRAFAAVSVAIFHTGYRFPHFEDFGYFGISVFFVISGYIMAMIATAKPDHFFLRRVIRIVPPYWTLTILLYIFARHYPGMVKATGQLGILSLLRSLLFVPFMKSNGLVMPVLFLGWTLNYEMFFYLTLALALRISRHRAPAISAGFIFLTLFVCGFPIHHSVIVHFFSDTVMVDFVLGMAAFYVCREFPQGVPARIRPFLALSFAGAAGTLIFIEGAHHLGIQPFWILYGLPSFVLIVSAALLAESGWDIRAKWVVALGDASYVLYLIHPYCEYLIDRVASKRVPWLALNATPGFLFALIATIFLALLLHSKVERPVVDYLNRKLVRRTVERAVPV